MPIDTGSVTYRLATASDAASIAKLHAESWRVAYRGMLPDTFLDNDVFDDRSKLWHERFVASGERGTTLTILAERNEELLGFAHSIIDEDATYGTLLDNLQVHPEAHRLGTGTRLMAETAAWLADTRSQPSLYLWVLESNEPARRFYEALGGQPVGTGVSQEGGGEVPSLRFWWRELDRLSDNVPEGHQPVIAGLSPQR